MLNRLPSYLPPLSVMLGDIGSPSTAELARAFGVTERVAKKWRALDDAPRPVLLALFWLTRWGQSAVDADAVNAARLHASIAVTLQREVDRLHAQLAWLTGLADFGSANAPTLESHAPGPRLALVHPPGEGHSGAGQAPADTARATAGTLR